MFPHVPLLAQEGWHAGQHEDVAAQDEGKRGGAAALQGVVKQLHFACRVNS